MKKNIVKIIVITLIVVLLMPSVALAASKRPYKDVTKKIVGKTNYTAIRKEKKWGTFDGVVEKNAKEFHPTWALRRWEFVQFVANTYELSLSEMSVYKKPNKVVTVGWLTKYLSRFSDEIFGVPLTYDDTEYKSNKKVNRALGSGYLYYFEKVARLRGATPVNGNTAEG